jgi:hypothetical protein
MTSFCQGYRLNLSTPSANPAGVACSSTLDAGPGFDDPFLFLAEFLRGVARARARVGGPPGGVSWGVGFYRGVVFTILLTSKPHII